MSFVRPVPWTQQPQIASPLAPLWRNNAKFFWSISNDGGVGKDLVSGRTPTVTGTAVRTPTTSGIAHGGGVYYNYSTLGVFSGSTQSWAALVAPEYTANLRSLFSQRDGGSARFDTYFNITEGASTSAGAILCATDGTPTNGWKTTSAFSETAFAVYSFSRDGANGQFYKNGRPITTTQVGTPASVAETQTYLFYQAGFAASFGANSRAIYFLASNARWPDSLHARLANPWDVYAPIARRIWVPSAGGATTHTSTGALAALAASIAGTATHKTLHTSTGALASQAAAVASTATHKTLHASTGALAAQAAAIAGTADHTTPSGATHTATGALAAQAAAIAGTAIHRILHTSTGALIAQSAAAIAGTAIHRALHTSSGALVSQSATIAGSASGPGPDDVSGDTIVALRSISHNTHRRM